MDPMMLYSLIYALAASGGREISLFGPRAACAREAFTLSAPGNRFPELWFEIPLKGAPWFDLHALTARGDLPSGKTPAPDTCAGYPAVFEWFADAENVRQLALSWDLNNGAPAAAVQLLLARQDDRTACDFLRIAGRPEAEPAFRAFRSRMPEDWFACYLGVFPSRPGHHLRVECIPSGSLQKAYAQDPALLAQDLSRIGFAHVTDSLLSFCQMLAAAPLQFELQFDINEDGSAGATLGASVRFGIGETNGTGIEPFRVDGAAGELMKEIVKAGLADDRWPLLEETAFAQRVSFRGDSCLLYCAPVFIKLRWHEGKPFDAKAYLMAGIQ